MGWRSVDGPCSTSSSGASVWDPLLDPLGLFGLRGGYPKQREGKGRDSPDVPGGQIDRGNTGGQYLVEDQVPTKIPGNYIGKGSQLHALNI